MRIITDNDVWFIAVTAASVAVLFIISMTGNTVVLVLNLNESVTSDSVDVNICVLTARNSRIEFEKFIH